MSNGTDTFDFAATAEGATALALIRAHDWGQRRRQTGELWDDGYAYGKHAAYKEIASLLTGRVIYTQEDLNKAIVEFGDLSVARGAKLGFYFQSLYETLKEQD